MTHFTMNAIKRMMSAFVALAAICNTANADPITPQRAKQIAAEFAGISTPKQVQRRRDVASRKQNLPLYIFSRGENQGYVFVSGSDCLPEIIGYTDSGDFDEATAAPGLLAYLDYYTQMAELSESQSLPTFAPRKAAGTHNIKPLLTCHWHQSWPYNNMCPYVPGSTRDRCVTGCVATAASQILYYWRKDLPERTKYKTPTYAGWSGNADVTESIPSGTPMKWDLLKDSYSGSDPKEYTDAVALLNYVVGTCDKMGYNTSSGAYIWDLVDPFNRQFNVASKAIYKRDYSQTAWEKAIIQDLEKGYPMEYAGYHIEDNGDWSGHAIVLDGYQINGNLFHFNFGWGGQGDGYYTVEENGVNGFGVDQSLVVDIHPKKPNLSGKIVSIPDAFLSRVENKIVVEVTNNGTLPYTGVNLFCLSGSNVPSASNNPTVSDKTTTIAVGETKRFTFEFMPSTTSKYRVYLTDANKNVLAKSEQLSTNGSLAQLTLTDMLTDGSETETMTICGKQVTVHHIYNSGKTNIYATFQNAKDATMCCPTIKAEYCEYDETNDTFGASVTKSLKSTVFQPGEQGVVEYNLPFSSLSTAKITDGKIYKFYLTGTAAASSTTPITMATPDSVVYFKLMGRDLTVSEGQDATERVVAGHFNAQTFADMAKNEEVARYDMTGVVGLNNQPVASNKNALFYMNASQGFAGTNVVVDGVADKLELTPGYNFAPREDFKAMKAVYHADQAVGVFGTAYVPFDCEVPAGMMARQIYSVSSTNVSECEDHATQIVGGTPYVILTSQPIDLVADNAAVSVNRQSQGSESLLGTWSNIIGTSTNWVLEGEDTPYFETAKDKQIPALTAYLESARRTRMSTTDLRARDNKARALACAIADACQAMEEYTSRASSTDLKALNQLVNDANKMLTEQPEVAEQTAMITALQEAVEAMVDHVGIRTDEGYLDKTMAIVNPSFEETVATKGWTRADKNGNAVTTPIKSSKITTSLTSYMSGADGVNVVSIAAGGYVLSQTVEGLPNGTYQLVVGVSANYGEQILIFAGDQSTDVDASDFGPYYLKDAVVDDVKVEDGTLLIGAASYNAAVKVDNFRLYLKEADATGIEDIDFTPASAQDKSRYTGVYDLSGRKLGNGRQLKAGIYVVNGKKVLK